MTGDLLEQATRALRERVDGTTEQALVSEEEILSRLEAPRPPRRVRVWPLAVAAIFVGSSVWAASSGRLAIWAQELFVAGDAAVVEQNLVAPTSVASARAGASRPEVGGEIGAPSVAAALPRDEVRGDFTSAAVSLPRDEARERVAPAERVSAREVPRGDAARADRGAAAWEPSGPTSELRSEAATSAEKSAAAEAPHRARELDLYERAHKLHFSEQDYARALDAWSAYLDYAPRGALALEARFHRAVCLVRVGRGEEARPTLRAFAAGAYGDYRSREAELLLGE